MSENDSENLATDAMRGDQIIDIEDIMRHEALLQAAEGDYMSSDDDATGITGATMEDVVVSPTSREVRGGPLIKLPPLPSGYKQTFSYGDGVGVVGPLSDNQASSTTSYDSHRAMRIQGQHALNSLQAIIGKGQWPASIYGVDYDRAMDLLFQVSQILAELTSEK